MIIEYIIVYSINNSMTIENFERIVINTVN